MFTGSRPQIGARAYGELGYDPWRLAGQVREAGTLALAAVERAAADLAAALPGVVVIAFAYEAEGDRSGAAAAYANPGSRREPRRRCFGACTERSRTQRPLIRRTGG